MTNKLLALYGLKWNPFIPGVPVEALQVSARIDSFRRRVLQLTADGGFALVTGNPGTGKSVSLRILAAYLSSQRDLKLGLISRPQANTADFYREMGDLFSVQIRPNNRWGGTKILRQCWQTHIDSALSRPVLIIDEAQDMCPTVLNELRLLTSCNLDSHILLTVILAGDGRLLERLRSEEFLPLESRIRVRLPLERATPQILHDVLKHALTCAGAPMLMADSVIATLADHAQGNIRTLMIMADNLLAAAAEQDARQIDDRLFFELYDNIPAKPAAGRRR